MPYSKKYYEKNRNRIIGKSTKWKKENSVAQSVINTRYHLHRYHRTKNALFDILGGKVCVSCGYDNILALQFDHINGGGGIEQRKFGNSVNMYKWYVDRPELARQTLQILCANCNWIKRHNKREFGYWRSMK